MLITLGRGLARPQRQSGVTIPSLFDILSSCVFDLDATHAASYSGSGQVWSNLVAAPATGEPQANYHFYLGGSATATTDDPTFNGVAGNSAAYWSFDGGDWFDDVSMPTSSYICNIHRTDASRPVTLGFAFRTPGTLTQSRLFSTNAASNTHGISLRMDTNGALVSVQSAGSGFASNGVLPSSTLTTNTDYLLLVALNSGSTGGEKYWLNSTTGSGWSAGYAPNAGSTSSIGACIGAQTTHGQPLGNGTRLYGIYMFNEILDNTKAAAVFSALNTRHGRTYA